MFKLKTADPTRRTPVYLQAYTKENFFWQLKLTAVLMAGLMVYDWYEERKFKQELKNFKLDV